MSREEEEEEAAEDEEEEKEALKAEVAPLRRFNLLRDTTPIVSIR